jgi:hypothetical protein
MQMKNDCSVRSKTVNEFLPPFVFHESVSMSEFHYLVRGARLGRTAVDLGSFVSNPERHLTSR